VIAGTAAVLAAPAAGRVDLSPCLQALGADMPEPLLLLEQRLMETERALAALDAVWPVDEEAQATLTDRQLALLWQIAELLPVSLAGLAVQLRRQLEAARLTGERRDEVGALTALSWIAAQLGTPQDRPVILPEGCFDDDEEVAE
jgi:hypothetical protein